VKTTPLSADDQRAIREWALSAVEMMNFRHPRGPLHEILDDARTRNLTLPKARALKKVIAVGLAAADEIMTPQGRDFAKCVVLRSAQWALDGRKGNTSVTEFRDSIKRNCDDMLSAIDALGQKMASNQLGPGARTTLHLDAQMLDKSEALGGLGRSPDLVLTSPPYPGVHVLYHRWQVDGRKETPAPYWITGCSDGRGASFYNFGDRHERELDTYFAKSLETLRSIRKVVKSGCHFVQLVAFSEPERDLPRYLTNMEGAGFNEVKPEVGSLPRVWRRVPNRRWHAAQKGATPAANEAVLIHRAR
jgi:hypothetical protein